MRDFAKAHFHYPGDPDNIIRLLEAIREKTGEKYFIMMHGDPTFSIPTAT